MRRNIFSSDLAKRIHKYKIKLICSMKISLVNETYRYFATLYIDIGQVFEVQKQKRRGS